MVDGRTNGMNEQAKFFWENRPTIATAALHDVMNERHRQMMAEGWTAKHDDEHANGSLAIAAAAYALDSTGTSDLKDWATWTFWKSGWARIWWKPRDARSNLVRAGALILAEIERLDRLAAASTNAGVSRPDGQTVPPTATDGGKP